MTPNRTRALVTALAGGLVLLMAPALAQLVDLNDAPNTAQSGIAKTLVEQIGAGQGDNLTPGSSAFIIQRDPFRSIKRGRQLFQRKFSILQGQGPRTGDGVGDIEADRSIGAGLIALSVLFNDPGDPE